MRFLDLLNERMAAREPELDRLADAMDALADETPTATRSGTAIAADLDAKHAEFRALQAEQDQDAARVAELKAVDEARRNAPTFSMGASAGVVADPAEVRNMGLGDLIDAGKRALDQLDKRHDAPADRLSAIAENLDDPTQARDAGRLLAVGSHPAYAGAFAKLVRDPQRGHLLWTDEERAAYGAADELTRSLGIGSGTGSALLPTHLDPNVMLSSDGSISAIRRLARVVSTSTNEWNGVSSAGVIAEWAAEGEEASDNSPTFKAPKVPCHRLQAFVPFSIEWGADAVDGLGELRTLLADAYDQLTAEAFVTGSGSGQPFGLVTAALAHDPAEDQSYPLRVAPVIAEALSAGDPGKLLAAVPPRFRGRAAYVANLDTILALGDFETENGSRRFPSVDNGRLLQRDLHEDSHMPALAGVNDSADADNALMIAGALDRAYVIANRLGATVELVPHLFGENGRPTGQRGLYLVARVGADLVLPEAVRVLNVATTTA